jgi:YD repeat-containing protein
MKGIMAEREPTIFQAYLGVQERIAQAQRASAQATTFQAYQEAQESLVPLQEKADLWVEAGRDEVASNFYLTWKTASIEFRRDVFARINQLMMQQAEANSQEDGEQVKQLTAEIGDLEMKLTDHLEGAQYCLEPRVVARSAYQQDGEEIFVTIFDYNMQGDKVQEVQSGGRVEMTEYKREYDQAGRLVRTEEYADEQLIKVSTVSYLEAGGRVTTTQLINNNEIRAIVEYHYDAEGKLVYSESRFDEDKEKITNSEVHEYNEQGDWTKLTTYSGEPKAENIIEVSEFEYRYDRSGRIVRRLHQVVAGEDQGSMETRKYSYDPDGRVIRVDRLTNGETDLIIFKEYDQQGRLKVIYNERPQIGTKGKETFEYGPLGQRITKRSFKWDQDENEWFKQVEMVLI